MNPRIKDGEGCTVENHPMPGKTANDRWRCVAGLVLLRFIDSGSHEHGEVKEGVTEENVKGATHPDGATCQSNLPEVFTVCVAGRLYGREHGRNPDDEDADVKTPNELAAGNSCSRESHA